MNGGSRYRSPDREGTMREGVEASAMNGEGCRPDGRNRRIPGHMRLPGGKEVSFFAASARHAACRTAGPHASRVGRKEYNRSC